MREQGSLIAFETGQVTAYALETAQERGVLFVRPGGFILDIGAATAVRDGCQIQQYNTHTTKLPTSQHSCRCWYHMLDGPFDRDAEMPPQAAPSTHSCCSHSAPDPRLLSHSVSPGDQVYEGQVVGQYAKAGDLKINVAKQKALTNMRAANKEVKTGLDEPRIMSLDDALEYITDDEQVEVTPLSIRIRKDPMASKKNRSGR